MMTSPPIFATLWISFAVFHGAVSCSRVSAHITNSKMEDSNGRQFPSPTMSTPSPAIRSRPIYLAVRRVGAPLMLRLPISRNFASLEHHLVLLSLQALFVG